MTNRNTARQAIMKEVEAALAEDDLLTVERIMARLSSTRIEKIIEDAVANAIDDANETELYHAEEFAVKHAEIREATEARREAVAS